MSTVVTSIAAALIVAGVLALLKTRWLYVVLPKAHLNTPFSKGHVALLTFCNHGFRTEESVEFLVRTTCRCELLATSKANVTLVDNKLTISRISRFQTITVVLLAEGKALAIEDVDTFESKESVGKIVEKKEQLNSVAQHLLLWPLLVVLLGLPFAGGTFYGKHQQQHVFEMVANLIETQPTPIQGYKIDRGDTRASINATWGKEIKAQGFPAKITAISRRGAYVLVEITISNSIGIEFQMAITGKGSTEEQEAGGFLKRHVSDLLVFPKETKKRTLELFLPESLQNKVLFIDYRLEHEGEIASVTDRVAL